MSSPACQASLERRLAAKCAELASLRERCEGAEGRAAAAKRALEAGRSTEVEGAARLRATEAERDRLERELAIYVTEAKVGREGGRERGREGGRERELAVCVGAWPVWDVVCVWAWPVWGCGLNGGVACVGMWPVCHRPLRAVFRACVGSWSWRRWSERTSTVRQRVCSPISLSALSTPRGCGTRHTGEIEAHR